MYQSYLWDIATSQHPFQPCLVLLEGRECLSNLCCGYHVQQWDAARVHLPNWLSTCWMEVDTQIHTDGQVRCSFLSLVFLLLGEACVWGATVKSDDRWTVWQECQKGSGLAVRVGPRSKCWQVAEKEASGRTVACRGSGACLQSHRWWRTDGQSPLLLSLWRVVLCPPPDTSPGT